MELQSGIKRTAYIAAALATLTVGPVFAQDAAKTVAAAPAKAAETACVNTTSFKGSNVQVCTGADGKKHITFLKPSSDSQLAVTPASDTPPPPTERVAQNVAPLALNR